MNRSVHTNDPEFASLIGRIVAGRFRILEPIASGAVGVVVLAEHTELATKVAIKVLRAQLTDEQRAVARFRREARAVSRLHHRNIVYITDFGQLDDGRLYLVMEHVDGPTLREELAAAGRFPVRRALGVLVQLAEALQVAHAAEVVHRDLKPENIALIKRRGRPELVKVFDFSIAKIIESDPRTGALTLQGEFFGTPGYLPPEQVDGAPTDHRVDLYGLGVLAFEMVTGRQPFQGPMVKILLAQKRGPIPVPSLVLGDGSISAAYDRFVLRLIARDPSERFSSAEAVLKALDELIREIRTQEPGHGDRGVSSSGLHRLSTGELSRVAWMRRHADVSVQEISSPRQRYLDQLARVAECIQAASRQSPALDEAMLHVSTYERQVRAARMDLAILQSRAEETESTFGQREAQLRHAVVDLSQTRDERCVEQGLSPENLPARQITDSDPQSYPVAYRELMDLAYQISELERRLSELERARDRQLEALERTAANAQADLHQRIEALNQARVPLAALLDPLRGACAGSPALRAEFELLDVLRRSLT